MHTNRLKLLNNGHIGDQPIAMSFLRGCPLFRGHKVLVYLIEMVLQSLAFIEGFFIWGVLYRRFYCYIF